MIIKDFKIHTVYNWTVEEATVVYGATVSSVFYSVPRQFDSMICRTNADAFFIAFAPVAAYI